MLIETFSTMEEAIMFCVEQFREYAEGRARRDPDWLKPLKGHDVACTCAEDAEFCHGDVLLRLANPEEAQP